VQVVEQHQQVPLGRLVHERAGDRLPGAEPRGGVVAVVLAGVRGKVVTEVAQHAGPGIERRSALVLGAPADHHGDPLGLRVCGELGAQPALADAGLAGQHREDGLLLRALEQPDEGAELVVAAHEWPAEPGRSPWCRRGARRRRLRTRGPALGRRPGESGVLPEHGCLQLAQLGARLQPELLGEDLAHLAEHLEGVGLPSGPGQRERAKAPEALAQRVRRRQHLQLAGHHRVPTQGETGHGAVLERRRPQLLEPAAFGLGCR
jgi:hypothetical protein